MNIAKFLTVEKIVPVALIVVVVMVGVYLILGKIDDLFNKDKREERLVEKGRVEVVAKVASDKLAEAAELDRKDNEAAKSTDGAVLEKVRADANITDVVSDIIERANSKHDKIGTPIYTEPIYVDLTVDDNVTVIEDAVAKPKDDVLVLDRIKYEEGSRNNIHAINEAYTTLFGGDK